MYIALWERYANVVLLKLGIDLITHFTFYPRIPKSVVGEKINGNPVDFIALKRILKTLLSETY